MLTIEQFFAHLPKSQDLFTVLAGTITTLGEVSTRVTKSQVAFRRSKAFAWVWMPSQYLQHTQVAPPVLTIALRRRDASPRWKEVVEPHPGRFTHHLELYASEDTDEEVMSWVREAWNEAG